PRTEPPHLGLASAIQSWANGRPIEFILEVTGASPGDFVRWAKQTIDLLDQVARAGEAVAAGHIEVSVAADEQLVSLSKLAREAKRAIRRGIVEASSAQ